LHYYYKHTFIRFNYIVKSHNHTIHEILLILWFFFYYFIYIQPLPQLLALLHLIPKIIQYFSGSFVGMFTLPYSYILCPAVTALVAQIYRSWRERWTSTMWGHGQSEYVWRPFLCVHFPTDCQWKWLNVNEDLKYTYCYLMIW